MICHVLLTQHICLFCGCVPDKLEKVCIWPAMASGGLQTFVNKVKSHAREFADSLTPVLKVSGRVWATKLFSDEVLFYFDRTPSSRSQGWSHQRSLWRLEITSSTTAPHGAGMCSRRHINIIILWCSYIRNYLASSQRWLVGDYH